MNTVRKMTDEKPLLRFKKIRPIPVSRIHPNPMNPRDDSASHEVEDLKESIREVGGVLVPVVVYPEGSNYILLDGERRWRASKELAKEDPKFSKIPANIIEKPSGTLVNLKTMFNIHYKRKGWSTAALAEAIGKFESLHGDETLSPQAVSKITGVTPANVTEARIFLEMPSQIRKRCLSGDLKEYYVILLGRNLAALNRVYPNVLNRYTRTKVVNAFIRKVDRGYVKESRSFNELSRLARFTVANDAEALFRDVFDRMIREESFTPVDATYEIKSKLGARIEEGLQAKCKEFLAFLNSYAKEERASFNEDTKSLLKKIITQIGNYV